MGAFRQPYGTALGFESQFKHHTGFATLDTAGLLKTNSGANLDVSRGEVFFTNNTVATNITSFRPYFYSTNSGTEEGRIINIIFLDANTKIQASSTINLETPDFGGIAHSWIELGYSNGEWYERNRSLTTVATSGTAAIQSIAGLTGGSGGYLTADRPVIAFTSTGSYLTVNAISGGYDGQVVNLVWMGSASQSCWLTAGANLLLTATDAFLMANSAAYTVVRVGSCWYNSPKSY